MNDILAHLIALYGDEAGRATFGRLEKIIAPHGNPSEASPGGPEIASQKTLAMTRTIAGSRSSLVLTERDAALITYGDQVAAPETPPLRALADFANRHLAGVVSTIHVLPFYPYSSDDGFSVLDYRAVNPALGDWGDVGRLGARFHLMFDAVINHVSAGSAWFRGFLAGEPRYRNFFIVVPDAADVSQVIRPRALPLLTRFDTPDGPQNVWTTFSADQVDLNFRNPEVLLEVVETLLFYIERGAAWIRLDAIAFLWKEFGTTCLHLPQTHRIIQLLRAVVDQAAPGVILLTETNVPHADNVSYFGDGTNEAHLVYNFALPPLTLHAFHTGDARILARWAAGLTLTSQQTTFFNFLASHDGIGLNPARGILPDAAIDALVARTQAHGGLVSYKHNSDGSASPYELNISYFDALSDPCADEPLDVQVDRFVAAHAIMLALVGVPGIYFHSLFGSRSWRAGVAQTGQNRTINREKLALAPLEHALADPLSLRERVFTRLAQFLRIRAAQPAFDPYGQMRVLDVGPAVLALLRLSPAGETALCLQNVSRQPQAAWLDAESLLGASTGEVVDLCTGQTRADSNFTRLAPYQTLWLARSSRTPS